MARVLVVDDERLIVLALRHILGIAGFEVLEAFDGRQALEVIDAERPDAVVLDVMMPELNGWDVLAAIRDDPETAETAVVMLTALGQEDDIRGSVMRGADLHISKPFEPDELVKVLRALLDGGDDQ